MTEYRYCCNNGECDGHDEPSSAAPTQPAASTASSADLAHMLRHFARRLESPGGVGPIELEGVVWWMQAAAERLDPA
jgi:hypothetical protein